MTDPYRIGDQPAPAPAAPPTDRRTVGRGLVWLVLVVSVAGNSVSSVAGAPTTVRLVLGVVTVLCIAGLIALRPRRSR
jgi:hypothetical protein